MLSKLFLFPSPCSCCALAALSQARRFLCSRLLVFCTFVASAAADTMASPRKNAVVTGANAGVGFETALGLSEQGFHVILACRSHARGTEAAARICELNPSASLQVVSLDLSDFSSVVACADAIASSMGGLHVLVNNAGYGGMKIVPKPTADGAQADDMYRVCSHAI